MRSVSNLCFKFSPDHRLHPQGFTHRAHCFINTGFTSGSHWRISGSTSSTILPQCNSGCLLPLSVYRSPTPWQETAACVRRQQLKETPAVNLPSIKRGRRAGRGRLPTSRSSVTFWSPRRHLRVGTGQLPPGLLVESPHLLYRGCYFPFASILTLSLLYISYKLLVSQSYSLIIAVYLLIVLFCIYSTVQDRGSSYISWNNSLCMKLLLYSGTNHLPETFKLSLL